MRALYMYGGALLALAAAACVPTDEALPLGAAQFTITARAAARTFTTVDGWSLHVDRFVIGFRTMSIVNLQDSNQCAYRGSGADANLIFEGATGSIVQSFNGMDPGPCPDVGLRLTTPDDYTRVGEGTTAADLQALVADPAAHSILTVTATSIDTPPFTTPPMTRHLTLRFDVAGTTSAFGNCRDTFRGAEIQANARDAIFVTFDASSFFRDTISTYSDVRFAPFVLADAQGDNDGDITMAEIDAFSLDDADPEQGGQSELYLPPDGSSTSTLGGWVRDQFTNSLHYGDTGLCDGLAPGTDVDQ